MYSENFFQTRTVLLFLIILPLYILFNRSLDAFNSVNDPYFAEIADTPSLSPTETDLSAVSQTPSQTSTPTLLPSASLNVTHTPTVVSTIQPSSSSTPLISSTASKTIELTSTPTINMTNTPGPTNTYIPLPSITLIFPIETITDTPEGKSTVESISSTPTDKVLVETPDKISSILILSIGTIIILWVVLAIFFVFFLQKLVE